MDFGRLRHKVVIQSYEEIDGPFNRGDWVDIGNVWAEIGSVSGKELVASGAELSSVTYKIIIRYREDITAKDRISYRGKIYAIKAILPDNKRTMLTLLCEEGMEDDY